MANQEYGPISEDNEQGPSAGLSVDPSVLAPRKGPLEEAAGAARPYIGFPGTGPTAVQRAARGGLTPVEVARENQRYVGRFDSAPAITAPVDPAQAAIASLAAGPVSSLGREVGDRGAGTAADITQSVPVPPPNVAPATGPIAASTAYDPRAAQAGLDVYTARDAANQQAKTQAMGLNAKWAADWTAQRDAESNARVANARATGGADMVLGSPALYEDQRKAIIGSALDANAKLAIANANLDKSQGAVAAGPPRNYIDEYGKIQNAGSLNTTAQSRIIEANARTTEAANRGELERAQAAGFRVSNEQHQRILDLAKMMQSATNPEDAANAERSIYAILGKSPDEFAINVIPGRKTVNAMGFQESEPDTVSITSKRTGRAQVIMPSAMTGAGGAKGPPPSAAEVTMLKKNPETAKQFEVANPGYKASDFLK